MSKFDCDVVAQKPLTPLSTEEMMAVLRFCNTGTAEDVFVQGMIKTGIRCKEKEGASPRIKLYAPHDDSSGTIVSIFKFSEQTVSFYFPEVHDSKFSRTLFITTLIDWIMKEHHMYLYAILDRLMPVVNIALEQTGMEKVSVDRTYYYWIKRELAISFEIVCPEGTCLKDLDLDMIEYMDKYWPHRFPGSVEYTKHLLMTNFGLGLFLKNETKPVAWAVCSQISSIAMLYTLEAHRRKGYAELIITALSKRLAKMGVDPGATVIVGNQKSQLLFEKMGFQRGPFLNFITLKSKS